MKIGIFGGSFNPPHKKHKKIALAFIQQNLLDKVIFVPVSCFYNKQYLAPNKDRYEMLKLLLKDEPNLEISCYEFDKLTYTYQTLTYFKEKYPKADIYFICGSDNLAEFHTWREYQYILENFKLLVIQRNKMNLDNLVKTFKDYQKNIVIAEVEEENLSSTMIRSAFFENRDVEIKEYLEHDIYTYIKKNKLYKQD